MDENATQTAPEAPPSTPESAQPPTLDDILRHHLSLAEEPAHTQEAAPEPEPAPEPAPAETPPQEDQTSVLARLMEQERALRAEEARVRQREEEAARQAREATERAERLSRYQKLEQTILSKDVNALAEALDMDPLDLARSLEQGTPADPARPHLQRMEEQLNQLRQQLETSQKQQEEARRQQMTEAARSEVRATIRESSPVLSALETVNPGLTDAVIERAATLRQETGRTPDLGQVIQGLQTEALSQVTGLLEALGPHLDSEAKARLSAFLAPTGDGAAVTQPTQRRPQMTLTNERASETTNFEKRDTDELPPDAGIEDYLAKYGH